jgi:hypothetical protein
VLLLFGDGEWLAGPADTAITTSNLTRLYGHPLRESVSTASAGSFPPEVAGSRRGAAPIAAFHWHQIEATKIPLTASPVFR